MAKTNTVKRYKSNKLDKCTTRTTESTKEDGLQRHQQDVAIEVQEQGEGWETASSRAKRTRCIYSMDDDLLQPRSAAEPAYSKSTECDSSASNSEGDHQVSEHSSRNIRVNSLLGPIYMENDDSMEIMLVNVELSVHTSPRAEHVPFVSVISEACGIAVLGYPLDVGEITETLPRNQLGWRPFKRTRTPVCYVTTSLGQNGKTPTKQFNGGETALNKTCIPVELVFSKILAAVGDI